MNITSTYLAYAADDIAFEVDLRGLDDMTPTISVRLRDGLWTPLSIIFTPEQVARFADAIIAALDAEEEGA